MLCTTKRDQAHRWDKEYHATEGLDCELDSFHFLNFPCFPNLLWPVCCWVWKNRGWPWIFLSDFEKWLPTSIYQRVLRFWLGLILIKLSLLFFFLQRVSFWGKVAMSNKSELQKPHSASISVKLMALSMAKRGQFYWDQRTMVITSTLPRSGSEWPFDQA